MNRIDTLKDRLSLLAAQTDWPLLLFVCGACFVKLYVKLAAIVFYAAWLFYRKAIWKKPAAPFWFYVSMPFLGLAIAALYGSLAHDGYLLGALVGTVQWFAAATIFYLLSISIRSNSAACLLSTAKAFFALNAFVTVAQFVVLMVQAKHPMPYWFYDSGLKYGASTGDHLTGMFFNNSLNNAAICLMGVIFFLSRGNQRWAILCVVVLLMCTSNVVMFGMLLVLLLMFVFVPVRQVRRDLSKILLLTVILYPTLSPQNFGYIGTVLERLTARSKPFIESQIPGEDSITNLRDSSGARIYNPARSLNLRVSDKILRQMPAALLALREESHRIEKPAWSYLTLEPAAIKPAFKKWYGVAPEESLLAHYGKPAKVFALRQTIGFLNTKPAYWMAGAGMGNFSSKLAVKMTGLRLQGSFPDKAIYISRPFMEYHFYTLMYVFSRDIKEHSVINMPGSTYLQLTGEYGIIGIVLFVLLYLAWFWKHGKRYKAARWMLIALLGLFWLDYWFEMMTLTVVAEFLMLSGIFVLSNRDASEPSDYRIDASV